MWKRLRLEWYRGNGVIRPLKSWFVLVMTGCDNSTPLRSTEADFSLLLLLLSFSIVYLALISSCYAGICFFLFPFTCAGFVPRERNRRFLPQIITTSFFFFVCSFSRRFFCYSSRLQNFSSLISFFIIMAIIGIHYGYHCTRHSFKMN